MSAGVNPGYRLQDGNPPTSDSESDHENPSSESEDSDTSDSSDDVSTDSSMDIDSPEDDSNSDSNDSDSDVEEWTENGWRKMNSTRQFQQRANLSDMLLKLKSYASV